MLIKYGDIFAGVKPGEVLAHGCNKQGVMGSGIAAAIKHQHPKAYVEYSKYVHTSDMGDVITAKSRGIIIANCITQKYYGRDLYTRYISYDAVDTAFKTLSAFKEVVNFPLIGGGLGNGNLNILKEIFQSYFPKDNGVLWIYKET